MDMTTIGIGTGVFVAVLYIGLFIWKRGSIPEITGIMVVFLAGYALVAGYDLLVAAFRGDPLKLPSDWRQYVGAVGVAGMGLSGKSLLKHFKVVLDWPLLRSKRNTRTRRVKEA